MARRGILGTPVPLIICSTCRERNGWVFENYFTLLQRVIDQIKLDAKQWAEAGLGHFRLE